MNKIPILVILISSLFFLAVDSCEGPDPAEQQSAKELTGQIINTIEEGLEANSLTEEVKLAFQENAKRKLKEYADYVSIYSDKTIDSVFRNNIGEQIQRLFIGNEAVSHIHAENTKPQIQLFSLESPELSEESELDKLLLTVDSMEVKKFLEWYDETTYIGKLGFLQTVTGIRDGDSTIIDRSPRVCEIFVIRTKKVFVNGSQMTWKVYLGSPEKP